MFCRMCGTKMNEGQAICPMCGTRAKVERRVEQLQKEIKIEKEEPEEVIKPPTLFSRANKPTETKAEKQPAKPAEEKLQKEESVKEEKSKGDFQAYGVPIIDERRKRYMERRKKLDEEKTTEEKANESLVSEKAEESYPSTNELPDIDVSDVQESDLSDLDLSDIDLSKLEDIGGVAEEKEIEIDKSIGCKNCGSVRGSIIYCPYCGKQFCTDCSLKAEKQKDMIFYKCPICKKEVIVQKS